MLEWSDVLTIGLLVLLEGLLSADNALVLAILVLGLPKDQQKKRFVTASSGRSFSGRSQPSSRCT